MTMSLQIESFFDKDTATFSYIVHMKGHPAAVIIDPILNYNSDSGCTSTVSADALIEYIEKNRLDCEWILETHIHADHLTASAYIKEKIGGKTGIGAHIKDVLRHWIPVFNTEHDTQKDGTQFDCLFQDNQTISCGNFSIMVLLTPGHTPACASYLIEDALFVGDTLFMPDVGTGRTDFPGADAAIMYESIQRILALPDETRIYTGHDYPPANREPACLSTVGEQKACNILIHKNITKENYIQSRNQRDINRAVPKLLLPSIQVNLRAGKFGSPEKNGVQYIKIPVNYLS